MSNWSSVIENKPMVQKSKSKVVNIHEELGYNKGREEKEGGLMDESTKIILNRIDQDIRDHKAEVRFDAKEREERFTNLVLEIKAEAKEREERAMLDAKEREERTAALLADIRSDTKAATKHIQVLSITTILSIVAIFVAIVTLVFTMQ